MIKKDLKGSYLVLWDESNPPLEGYEQEMIQRNQIPGLLRCDILPATNGAHIKYDITAMQSLASIYAGKQLNCKDAKRVMEGVCQVIRGIKEYILDEEGILFDPDYIFYNYKEQSFRFCYYPGTKTNVFSGLHALAEFLMDRVDHTDKPGTRQVYMFYELTNGDNYSVREIEELIWNPDHVEFDKKDKKIQDDNVEVTEAEADSDVIVEDESLGNDKKKRKLLKSKQKSNKTRTKTKNNKKANHKRIKPMDILVWIASIGIVMWIIYDYFLRKYIRYINPVVIGIGLIVLALIALIIIRIRKKKGLKNTTAPS